MTQVVVTPVIYVGSHKYTIAFDEVVEWDGHDATINYRRNEIVLNPHRSEQDKPIDLIHELLHLVSRVWCVDLRERDIDALGEGLGQVLFTGLGIELDWSDIPIRNVEVKEV